MPGIARMGDMGVGTCSCHESTKSYTTTFITGSPTVLTENAMTVMFGAVGISSCGHATTAMMVMPTVLAENQGVHRMGDMGIICGGTYTTILASSTVLGG